MMIIEIVKLLLWGRWKYWIKTSQWWIWNHYQSQSSSFDLRSFLFQFFPYRHLPLWRCFCSSSLLPITSRVFVWAKIKGLSVTCWSHDHQLFCPTDDSRQFLGVSVWKAVILTVELMKMTELFQFNISRISVPEDARSSSTSPNKHLLTRINHFQFRLNNMQIFLQGISVCECSRHLLLIMKRGSGVGGPLMQCYNCSRPLLYFCKLRLILDQIWVQQQQKMDFLSSSSFCQVL